MHCVMHVWRCVRRMPPSTSRRISVCVLFPPGCPSAHVSHHNPTNNTVLGDPPYTHTQRKSPPGIFIVLLGLVRVEVERPGGRVESRFVGVGGSVGLVPSTIGRDLPGTALVAAYGQVRRVCWCGVVFVRRATKPYDCLNDGCCNWLLGQFFAQALVLHDLLCVAHTPHPCTG